MLNELKTRGVHDILIAVVDGVTGLADAIGRKDAMHLSPLFVRLAWASPSP